ncbi:unnamed protein product [Effrenium voratum]|uniref:Uncharacterized protein n=1 Tax=Effrenium voratum TaxID=2562239 RepID=A0AA36HT17_9DINO|nr:unnamed protein product [Effrenium voratum]
MSGPFEPGLLSEDGPRAGVALLAPAEAPQARSVTLTSDLGSLRAAVRDQTPPARGFAQALQEALEAFRELPAFDVEPGDSSEEEGGSSEGIRLRVRLRREDDKWGIKWHKQVFKSSHRLVVDEIVEGSPIDRWNASQPPALQVRYGDRLERLNGVRAGNAPAQVAGKFREELQKEEIRALFWRPGTPPKDAKAKVLVAASEGCGGLAAAQAACCAHGLLYEEAKNVESAWRRLSGQSPQALGEWQTMLDTLVSPAESAESDTGRQEEEVPKEAPVEASDGREDPERPLDADVDDNEGEPEVERTPQWTYRCRKCGVALFHDLDVLPHQKGKDRLAGYDWRSQAVAAAAEGHALCSSMFVQPMKWMGDITCQTGRLVCGNGLCKQKLGGFSWHGLPCSCGEWQSPAFQIHNARLDCMPAGRTTRGPTPSAVFEGT